MKLSNPTNAFIRLEHENAVLLIDPWVTQPAYRTWYHWPPVPDIEEYLEGATHVLITHQHEDHCDIETLKKLRGVTIFCPRPMREWLISKLDGAPGAYVSGLDADLGPLLLDDGDLYISLIPPMNSHGQDDRASDNYAIDHGYIVQAGDWKGVFLSDNTPYRPQDAGPALERMKGCDVLGVSFNGMASDYPLCYGLSDEETIRIIRDRERRRREANLFFIMHTVEPKSLLLYSSDFWLAGPQARRFAQMMKTNDIGGYAFRWHAANYYRAYTGLPVIEAEAERWKNPRDEWVPLEDAMAEGLSIERRWLYGDLPNVTREELQGLATLAARRMCEAADGKECDWILWMPAAGVAVDLSEQTWYMLSTPLPPSDTHKRLTVDGDPRYLAAILRGDIHWNAARLSFLLEWRREPDEYSPALYDLLNHFHA